MCSIEGFTHCQTSWVAFYCMKGNIQNLIWFNLKLKSASTPQTGSGSRDVSLERWLWTSWPDAVLFSVASCRCAQHHAIIWVWPRVGHQVPGHMTHPSHFKARRIEAGGGSFAASSFVFHACKNKSRPRNNWMDLVGICAKTELDLCKKLENRWR